MTFIYFKTARKKNFRLYNTVLISILLRYRYRLVTIDSIALPTVTVFCPTWLMVHQRYTSLRTVTSTLPSRYLTVTDRYLTVTYRCLIITDRYQSIFHCIFVFFSYYKETISETRSIKNYSACRYNEHDKIAACRYNEHDKIAACRYLRSMLSACRYKRIFENFLKILGMSILLGPRFVSSLMACRENLGFRVYGMPLN